jgi:hypothetical protein
MNPDTIAKWVALATSAQPLVQAGILAATQVVGLFRQAHPTATDDELNVALGDLVTQATAELEAIAAERAAAVSTVPTVAGGSPAGPGAPVRPDPPELPPV